MNRKALHPIAALANAWDSVLGGFVNVLLLINEALTMFVVF